MASSKLQSILQRCEDLIRHDAMTDAGDLLAKLSIRDVPRAEAQRLSHLLYRVGFFNRSMSVLAPIVRPDHKIQSPATALEKATYAIGLLKVGSFQEGMKLLAEIRPQIPQAILYSAFGHMMTWDYAAALEKLNAYLQSEPLSDYERAVARVNRIAALVATEQLQEARAEIASLTANVEQNGWLLLRKNLSELAGQLAAAESHFDLALQQLKKVFEGISASRSEFLLQKWSAIFQLRMSPRNPEALLEIDRVRKMAASIHHWESVRELDRLQALATEDAQLYARVYFGTPHEAYRRNLEAHASSSFTLPNSFVWGSQQGQLLDMVTGKLSGDDQQVVKPGQLLHRSVQALLSDFYRTLYIGQLHSVIFVGENYNPVSSPGRVANVLRRTRRWIEANQLPLTIDVNNQFHKLLVEDGAEIGIRVIGPLTEKEDVNLLRLKDLVTDKEFTAQDASNILQISRSSAVRALRKSLGSGQLERKGQGPSTKYRFAA